MKVLKRIELLWTGGFDSSFRLLELSRMDVEVQPYYIVHRERITKDREALARKKVLEFIASREETKAHILPVKEVRYEDIPYDEEIAVAYKSVCREFPLGGQYEWLSMFAAVHKGIELGHEKFWSMSPKPGRLTKYLLDSGSMKFDSDGVGYLDESVCKRNVYRLYGNYRFPIALKDETTMVNILQQWGYEEIIHSLWFCFHPRDGKPCGVCAACSSKMRNGMQNLLPKEAWNRYAVYQGLLKKDSDAADLYKIYVRYPTLEKWLAALDKTEDRVAEVIFYLSAIKSKADYFDSLEGIS